jgi:hypothetical protein
MKPLLKALGLDLLVCAWVLMFSADAWAFSLLGLPQEANFALGEWQGSVEGGYEFEDQQVNNAGTSGLSLIRNRYDERFDVRNEGYSLIDPRLLEGSAAFSMDFYQEQDKYAGRNASINGLLYGYDLSDTIFGQRAYTATVFSNHHEAQMSTEFAGRTDVTTSSTGLIANLRDYSFLREVLPYFTSTLDAREVESDETTSQLGYTYKLDETRDIVTYDALKGFQTADLDFYYQYLDDRLRGTNNLAYQTSWAGLDYSLDFGPTLNRRWDSRINYLTRSGEINESYVSVDEILRIEHFRNLSTVYQYLLNRIEAGSAGTTTDQTAIFTLNHQLYKNLSSVLILEGDYETLPGGRTYDYMAELGEGYTRSIPLGGTFYLDGDGLYEVTDDSISGGKVSVIDEPHIAGAHGAGFFLKNPFVVQSTIVIYDTRGGGRIPTVRGVDYDVFSVGDLTQIVVLPTSIVIASGDPLAVSYVYQTAPSARYQTTSLTATTGVNFRWIDGSYQHQVIRESLLSGQAAQAFLYDATSDTAKVAVHKEWERIGARASALYEDYNSSMLSFRLQSYGGHVFIRARWRTTFTADANEILTDYTSPNRSRTSTDQFQLTLDHYTEAGNRWSAYGRMLQMQDSFFPTETELDAGLQGYWTYGKFQVVPIASWINVKWGAVKTNDLRFQLRITRFL